MHTAGDLEKYRDLVLASIDYYLETGLMRFKTKDFDSDAHYRSIKAQAISQFEKGHLSKLKQWYRDLTDIPRNTHDLKFEEYIKEKTGQKVSLQLNFKKQSPES